jgi:citrate lyase subunit beta/citryl-CoA lyase
MLARAATLPADQVLIDLEDAVPPSEKAAARPLIVEALRTHDYSDRSISLRINAVETPWCYRDVIEVVEAAGNHLQTIVIPKVAGPGDVEFVDRLLTQIESAKEWEVGRIGLETFIETAEGVQHIDDIARASPRLQALIFGPGDLSADLGLAQLTIGKVAGDYPGDLWHYVLMRILIAARANHLLAIDGPYAVLADTEGLERSARISASLGFDGKWVIHPGQIETVNRVFTPDAHLYRRAEAILAAYRQATEQQGRGAVRYEGEMIDEATRRMAEAIARRGRWLGLSAEEGRPSR